MTIGKNEIDLKAGPVTMWFQEGRYPVSIAGGGSLNGLVLKGQGTSLAPAKMLPKEFQPKSGSILVEAEKPSAEGEIKFKLMEKVGASGKRAHCCWDHEGQWAEWRFDVAAAGDYELLIRGASEDAMMLRELLLDGKPLLPDVGVVRLQGTGGWCRTADDWRYFAVVNAKGDIARIHLESGAHTLRMNQLGGSMNLDLFAWQPAQ